MIVTIASAWSASGGGVNAFNIELTRALARVGRCPVLCAVLAATDREIAAAASDGVTLVTVTDQSDGKPLPSCVEEIAATIGEADSEVRLWVGHDLVSGEAAARGAEVHGGRLALIHHMDYASYQNFSGDRGDETFANTRRQISLFRTHGSTLFGVGSWLAGNAGRLGGQEAHTLVPGFPAVAGVEGRGRSDSLLVVSAGRFSPRTELLKRVGAVVGGYAMAARDGASLSLLRRATLTMLGVDGQAEQALLHRRVTELAGRPVNLVAAGYVENPTAVAEIASVSHLVIVPSRHEGFGLVGWEAIGTSTPLIVGAGTGIADQLRTTLEGQEEGLVSVLDLDGSDTDFSLISGAIRKIASDLPTALRRAAILRHRLVAELACTWTATAQTLLERVGLGSMVGASGGGVGPVPEAKFSGEPANSFEHCVELGAGAGQGSTRRSVQVVAELRFGVTELEVEGIEAELALERVVLEVRPRTGKLVRGDRLGEGRRTAPGIQARAGGVWLIEPPGGVYLVGKMLGEETLCVVESAEDHPAIIDLEVTAARRDIRCDLRSKRRLSKTVEKVMGVFLKDCIYKPVSGHVLLSTLALSEDT